VNVDYVDLVDYVAIAAEVTGVDTAALMRTTRLDLADSALHAPASGFGDVEFFFPDFVTKAAVLVVRLTQNHPLTDGNKRAAWVALRVFLEINRWCVERAAVDRRRRARDARDRRRRLGPRADGSLARRPHLPFRGTIERQQIVWAPVPTRQRTFANCG
jgi:death-on-curing protein